MATSNRSGFTLIEIMVVIMIMGVIAAGAFGGMRYLQKVRMETTRTKLGAVDTMLEQYNTQIGEYPTDLQELIDGPSKPQLQKRWGQPGEPFAKADELKDAWGGVFVYSLLPKGSRPPFELYSTGPKGDKKIFSPTSSQE